jgi:general secretion pathway protein N
MVVAATFVIAALALLPLRIALSNAPSQGLTASSASGTIWQGQLTDAAWRGIRLGTLDIALQPLALLTANAKFAVGGPDLTATLVLGEGIEALSGRRPLTGLPITSLTAQDVTLRFKDGQCEAASGTITVTLPVTLAASPTPITATPRCTGATASLTLASPDGLTHLTLALSASGRLSIAA